MNRPEFLAALAQADENQGADPRVEYALLEALRRRHRSMWIRRASGWGALAAAAVLLWVVAQPSPKLVQRQTAVVVSPPVVEMPAALAPAAVAVARPPRHKAPRAAVKREIATEFIPVMLDPDPFERGRLVRVKLPRSALTAFGLPMNEERVEERIQADVLVGEDGLARAIRFVK